MGSVLLKRAEKSTNERPDSKGFNLCLDALFQGVKTVSILPGDQEKKKAQRLYHSFLLGTLQTSPPPRAFSQFQWRTRFLAKAWRSGSPGCLGIPAAPAATCERATFLRRSAPENGRLVFGVAPSFGKRESKRRKKHTHTHTVWGVQPQRRNHTQLEVPCVLCLPEYSKVGKCGLCGAKTPPGQGTICYKTNGHSSELGGAEDLH